MIVLIPLAVTMVRTILRNVLSKCTGGFKLLDLHALYIMFPTHKLSLVHNKQ